jgi:hypothetical protein
VADHPAHQEILKKVATRSSAWLPRIMPRPWPPATSAPSPPTTRLRWRYGTWGELGTSATLPKCRKSPQRHRKQPETPARAPGRGGWSTAIRAAPCRTRSPGSRQS